MYLRCFLTVTKPFVFTQPITQQESEIIPLFMNMVNMNFLLFIDVPFMINGIVLKWLYTFAWYKGNNCSRKCQSFRINGIRINKKNCLHGALGDDVLLWTSLRSYFWEHEYVFAFSSIYISWTRFLSLARSKLRLRSANHRTGYFSNRTCDWLSIVWAYSEQDTENGPWVSLRVIPILSHER